MVNSTKLNAGKVSSLQFLRGIASTAVLFIHCGNSVSGTNLQLRKTVFEITLLGSIGVDIFFVISGAIMTIVLSKNSIGPIIFLKKRCIRILPLYWILSFALYIHILIFKSGLVPYQVIFKTLTIFPIFDQPITGSSYHIGIGLFPLLQVGWTLQFEFLFYFIIAGCLFFSKKFASIIASFILLIAVLLGMAFNKCSNLQFLFITNPLMIEFVLGAICGWLYLNKKINISNGICYLLLMIALSIIGIDIILTIWHGFHYLSQLPLYLKILLGFQAPTFFLVLSLLLLEKNAKFRINTFFTWLGEISFSTYLVHVLVLGTLSKCCQKLNLLNHNLFILISIPLCIVAGYAVHFFLEKPIISFFNRLGKPVLIST